MPIFKLEAAQTLPSDIDTAWQFFSDPHNLAVITPPEMRFQITGEPPSTIHPGLIITYRLTPLPILPLRVSWATEIAQVNAPYYFADDQIAGPYALWHHQHHFQEVENGVLVTDQIHWSLPLDPISAPVANSRGRSPATAHLPIPRARSCNTSSVPCQWWRDQPSYSVALIVCRHPNERCLKSLEFPHTWKVRTDMTERQITTGGGCAAGEMSRRSLLRASSRAGVGAAGLALVGCGGDDDDGQQTVTAAQQQQQQAQQQAAQQQAMQQQQQQAMQQQQQQQADQQASQADQQEQPQQEQAQQEQQQTVADTSGLTRGGTLRFSSPAATHDYFDPHRGVFGPTSSGWAST